MLSNRSCSLDMAENAVPSGMHHGAFYACLKKNKQTNNKTKQQQINKQTNTKQNREHVAKRKVEKNFTGRNFNLFQVLLYDKNSPVYSPLSSCKNDFKSYSPGPRVCFDCKMKTNSTN